MLNQSVLKPYGTLTSLRLDTSKHSLEAEVELKGETKPVHVQIHEYEIGDADGAAYILIKGISTSREWLTRLARDFAVGRRFNLPESARSFVSMIR